MTVLRYIHQNPVKSNIAKIVAKLERDYALSRLKKLKGISIRQIARVTGISGSVINSV